MPTSFKDDEDDVERDGQLFVTGNNSWLDASLFVPICRRRRRHATVLKFPTWRAGELGGPGPSLGLLHQVCGSHGLLRAAAYLVSNGADRRSIPCPQDGNPYIASNKMGDHGQELNGEHVRRPRAARRDRHATERCTRAMGVCRVPTPETAEPDISNRAGALVDGARATVYAHPRTRGNTSARPGDTCGPSRARYPGIGAVSRFCSTGSGVVVSRRHRRFLRNTTAEGPFKASKEQRVDAMPNNERRSHPPNHRGAYLPRRHTCDAN